MVLFSLSLWILFIDLSLFPPSSSSWAKVICGIFFWFSFVGCLNSGSTHYLFANHCVILLCIFSVPSWSVFHSLQTLALLGVLFYSNTANMFFFPYVFLTGIFRPGSVIAVSIFFDKFFIVPSVYFLDTDANTSPRTLTEVYIGVC